MNTTQNKPSNVHLDNGSDTDLVHLFSQLKRDDTRNIPSFATMYHRARTQSRKVHSSPVPWWSRPLFKVGIPLALILLVFSLDLFFVDMLQKQGPDNDLVQLIERFDTWHSPTRSLLNSSEFDQYWSASVTSLSSWESPSTSLMEVGLQADFQSGDNS